MNLTKHNVNRTIYFSVLFNHIKKNGLFWTIKKTIIRCFKELAWITLLPIAIFLHFLGFRLLLFRVEHIGHLALECDSFIKEIKLGLLAKPRFCFVLAQKSMVSNNHLLNYWKHQFYIIKNPLICAFLSLLTRRYFVRYDVSRYISSYFDTQDIYEINKLWADRPPVLTLSNDDEKWGEQTLGKLGILPHQWFVCVHVREGGFLPHNELIQSHRNASVVNTIPAIEEIVKRGGVVIRMGDSTMTPLPPMKSVIDYAHHPLKSERLDVVLCAKAKIFLGCTSGLVFLSMIFGVPIAQANMIPIAALGIRSYDLSIPKLLWSESLQRYLNFKEIMTSDIGRFYFTHQYKEAKISCIENSPEDILLLIREMMDRLDGSFVETEEDQRLHMQYMSLFKEGHYSYGATSRVCTAFLRKYQNLIL